MRKGHTPLASALRPQTLDQMVGQKHILKKTGWIQKSIERGKPLSILLYGPPGCGKTTLARLYAKAFDGQIVSLSGVESGTKQIKDLIQKQRETSLFSRPLILFIDEIHRYNKAQQDTLLPSVEEGIITLIGATTENPSFCLNDALLSRMQTLTLKPLAKEDLRALLNRYPDSLPLLSEAKEALIDLAGGDARYLYNMLESIESIKPGTLLTKEELVEHIGTKAPLYDKQGEGHYNLISAFHKSIRASDPDAALYYLARMCQGGEDCRFILRRLLRAASEDIGLADPWALNIVLNAKSAFDQVGSPEGEIAIAQATLYLALAPKSNRLYTAFNAAWDLAKKTGHHPPPKNLLNAPNAWAKEQGYGKDYVYDPETKEGCSNQATFPSQVERTSFYKPIERGFEREMKKRLDYFEKIRLKK